MAAPELEQRMRGWLSRGYRAVLFEDHRSEGIGRRALELICGAAPFRPVSNYFTIPGSHVVSTGTYVIRITPMSSTIIIGMVARMTSLIGLLKR